MVAKRIVFIVLMPAKRIVKGITIASEMRFQFRSLKQANAFHIILKKDRFQYAIINN